MTSVQMNMPALTESSPPGTTKPNTAAIEVKPCCVCKEEKTSRDNCMLFSKAEDPQQDCASTIDKYKRCMAGFGFHLP